MNGKGPEFDVAVVGTGVVGLAAALGLAQQRLRVALVGPRAARPAGAASNAEGFDARIYAVSPGSVRLLERLSVWAQVDAARCTAVTSMRIFGDTQAELTMSAYAAAVERLATIIEERELARVLESGVAFQSSIKRMGASVVSRALSDDRIALQLDDGNVVRAALAIAADGANSALRNAAGIAADTRLYGQSAIVANFACEKPHLGVAYQWFTVDGIVALLPLPGRCVSLVWSAPDAVAAELRTLDPQSLARKVFEVSGSSLGALSPLGTQVYFALRAIGVDSLIAPRLAMIGDAAHVVHPLAGQGLNLGLQDAAELLRVLAGREGFRELGDQVLLRRYERARAEDIGLMKGATDALARLFAIDDPVIKRARNLGLRAVDAISPLKSALIRHALG